MWVLVQKDENKNYCSIGIDLHTTIATLLYKYRNIYIIVVMDDSEIYILDSIFWKKNLDFELRAIFSAYKGLKWSMRAMVSTACVTCYFSISVIHTRLSLQSNMAA